MERILYFARENESGKEFHFYSNAVLDIGTPCKSDNGTPGVVYDLAVETPMVSVEDLHLDYEIMRGLSM